MAKINLQFHAEPTELVSQLLPAWLDGMPVDLAAERFFPEYQVAAVTKEALRDLQQADVSRVAVSVRPLQLDVGSAADFVRANPDALVVTVGALTAEGLRESALAAWTDDKESLRCWRSVRQRAMNLLRSDAYAVNPASGARQRAKDHFHSPGAATLAANGIPLLASAGWNRYELSAD